MRLTVKRFADNGNATMGILYIDGVFECFTIEDEERCEKVAGETRIPEGIYDVVLRAEGGYYNKYKEKYKDLDHEGMLCITNAPDYKIVNEDFADFQYVLIHTGNTEKHTAACLLVNDAVSGKTFSGSASVDAYKDMYPKVLAAALTEKVTIEYIDVEDGR